MHSSPSKDGLLWLIMRCVHQETSNIISWKQYVFTLVDMLVYKVDLE